MGKAWKRRRLLERINAATTTVEDLINTVNGNTPVVNETAEIKIPDVPPLSTAKKATKKTTINKIKGTK